MVSRACLVTCVVDFGRKKKNGVSVEKKRRSRDADAALSGGIMVPWVPSF